MGGRTDSVSFDRMADDYDRTRGGTARGVLLGAAVAPHLVEGTVLEVGVGTATVAHALADLGFDAVGIDISPKMLAHAAQRLGPKVAVADGAISPLATASVDNVVTCWVLHLVGDRAATVDEIARVLKPGGRWVNLTARGEWTPDDIHGVQQRLHRFHRDVISDEELAAHRSFDVVEKDRVANPVSYDTPNEVADAIEQRIWSSLWDIDDDDWVAEVEPVIEALRALPQPDRLRARRMTRAITVLERVG